MLLLRLQLHAQRPVELFPLRLDARGVHRALQGHTQWCGERRAGDDELVRVMIGNVKLAAAGVAQAARQQKAEKKAAATARRKAAE